MLQNLKLLAFAFATVALGLFTRWADGPPIIAWMLIGLGTLGGLASIVEMVRPGWMAKRASAAEGERVVLKDGRDYRVDVTDGDVGLTHLRTGEERRMPWSEVTYISVIAIDGYPAGRISFVLHRGSELLEIPWDAKDNQQLLPKMQEKFPGFDDRAVIEASGMLHGFKQLWQRTPA
jgi:hypothetical protein